MSGIQNITLNEQDELIILDQTQLPNRLEYKTMRTAEDCYTAIKNLEVRGAPAIGIFAGYSMYILMKEHKNMAYNDFLSKAEETAEYLNSSRPTAVNLSWALKRMVSLIKEMKEDTTENILSSMRNEAIKIHQEDIAMCTKISEYGLTLIKDGDTVLTHCNAGPLATSKYGTATGPIFLGTERGMHFHVYSDETRPLLQGARLTSYELSKAGVDVTLICDNMASIVMKQRKINAVFVGCDRIAANGDFANKIGTSGVAVLAKYYGIPFYTLGPSSTIDFNTPTGDDIPIEERNPDEIKTMWYKEPMALKEVNCYNPSFDVTDHSLLTAIVTERGVVYPPFKENLKKLFEK